MRHKFRFMTGVRKHRQFRYLALVALVVAALAVFVLPIAGVTLRTIGQTAARITPVTDPTALPRLEWSGLRYEGAFRLPADLAGETFASGGGPLAFNPLAGTLFVGARSGKIAEITVPTPLKADVIADLPVASYVQGFEDPTEGRIKDVAAEGAALSGLLVHRGRLYGTGLIYYDAKNAQTVSHFSRPVALASKGAAGPMKRVWKSGRTGFVAGYLAAVPPEWQSKLGGPALTGQCCQPIITRTSFGPAAFAWEPADLDRQDEIDAIPLVYYPSEHPTLGPWSGSNSTYGAATQVAGVVLPSGKRTALFIGRNGMGPYCYGNATSDKSLDGTFGKDGQKLCYDPASADKGQHAYPYRFQMWAYDLNDLAEVRAGRKEPWEVKPYGVWPFDLPYPEPSARVGGVTYDAERQRIYISQRAVHHDGYAYRPLIHVFQIP